MKSSVLIIGHADADGHVIVEQVRRNLELIGNFNLRTVVDPERTKDHKIWLSLETMDEVGDANVVFFVDLMFAPSTFASEASALVEFVSSYPDKKFFLLDHHPLPLRRLSDASNLRVIYRPNVFQCTFGPRSGLMVIAALCEKQKANVADIVTPEHETISIGMRRAAAIGGPLPGPKLLAILKANRWDLIRELGEEDKEFHFLPRGRRSSKGPKSKVLTHIDEVAQSILSMEEGKYGKLNLETTEESSMAYDMDIRNQRYDQDPNGRLRLSNEPVPSKDLEALVTLLEVAALSLTTSQDTTFTYEELFNEAREYAGDQFDLDKKDVNIILEKASFIKKLSQHEFCLR